MNFRNLILLSLALATGAASARDTNRYDRVEEREGVEFSQRGGLGTSNEVVTAVSWKRHYESMTNMASESAQALSNLVVRYAPTVELVQDFDATKLENLDDMFLNAGTGKVASVTRAFSNAVASVTAKTDATKIVDGTSEILATGKMVTGSVTNDIAVKSDIPDGVLAEDDVSVSYPDDDRGRTLAYAQVGSKTLTVTLPADLGMDVSNGTSRTSLRTNGGTGILKGVKSGDGSQAYVTLPDGSFLWIGDLTQIRVGGAADSTGRVSGDRVMSNLLGEDATARATSVVSSYGRVTGAVQYSDQGYIDATSNGSNAVLKASEDYLSVKSRVSALEDAKDVIYETATNWSGNAGTKCTLYADGAMDVERFRRVLTDVVTTNKVSVAYPKYLLHKETCPMYNNQTYTIDRVCYQKVSGEAKYSYDQSGTTANMTCTVVNPAAFKTYSLSWVTSQANGKIPYVNAASPFSAYVAASGSTYLYWNGQTPAVRPPATKDLVNVPTGNSDLETVLTAAAAGTRTTVGYGSLYFKSGSNATYTGNAEWYFDTSVGGLSDDSYERVVSVETNAEWIVTALGTDRTYLLKAPKETEVTYDADGRPVLVTDGEASDVKPWKFTSYYGSLSYYGMDGSVTNVAPYRGIVNGKYLWSVTNDVSLWSSDPYVYWGNVIYDPVARKWTFSSVECTWLNSGGVFYPDPDSGFSLPMLYPSLSANKYISSYPVLSKCDGYPFEESTPFGEVDYTAAYSDGEIDEETGTVPGQSKAVMVFAAHYFRDYPSAVVARETNVVLTVRSSDLPSAWGGRMTTELKKVNSGAVLFIKKGE